VEGKSKFTFLVLVKDSTAITVTAAIKKAFSIDPGLPIHTITSDNGQEFSCHEPPINYPHHATLLVLTTPGSEDSVSTPTAGLDSTYLKKRTS